MAKHSYGSESRVASNNHSTPKEEGSLETLSYILDAHRTACHKNTRALSSTSRLMSKELRNQLEKVLTG